MESNYASVIALLEALEAVWPSAVRLDEMEPRLAEKFVGMYVNHYTVDAGEVIPKAAQKLLDMGYEVGLIPNRVEVEFVR